MMSAAVIPGLATAQLPSFGCLCFYCFYLQQQSSINVGLDTVKTRCCATLGACSGYRPLLRAEGDKGTM